MDVLKGKSHVSEIRTCHFGVTTDRSMIHFDHGMCLADTNMNL